MMNYNQKKKKKLKVSVLRHSLKTSRMGMYGLVEGIMLYRKTNKENYKGQ